ncbi:MAG: sugar ABC transporter permease [Clostridia bacterium]|nr:sugar ABC transporter permease [Clostridia bacterium]
MKKQTFGKGVMRVIINVILVVAAIASLYPILWIVMSSFNPGTSLFSSTIFPSSLTLSHYVDLFTKNAFGTWYINTFKIAVFTTILSVFFITITAYALSQFRFKGRRFGLLSMLVLQMFPGFMSMVAIYLLLLQLELLDTHLGLILVYAGGSIPGGAWIVKGYLDGIPRSMAEAARIDGANNFQIFAKVMMPLSVPIITFISLTSFTGPWMDFIFSRLVLRSDEKITLAIGLFGMVSDRMHTDFTTFAAGAVLVAAPITILYTALQKFIIHGLTEGASKT